jgi:uncharacterized repeat protein (TIGR03803 family)
MKRPAGFRIAISTLSLVSSMLFLITSTQSQTLTVLHNFTGGQDGAQPEAGLTRDAAGNLYGTAYLGGNGSGTAFRLQHQISGWTFLPLYAFDSGSNPTTVIVGPNGSIYGITRNGGGCCGDVFNLTPSPTPPVSVLSPWNETELHHFAGFLDGGYSSGNLVFDQFGNLYGTTPNGGPRGAGTVYVLTPSSGGWTLTNIYLFLLSIGDGAVPIGGVIMDGSGNLYGTTVGGGAHNDGTVFELVNSGNEWTEKILYSFQNASDGKEPLTTLTLDQSGNLYGTTLYGGSNNTGTVFELIPSENGTWNFNLIYIFSAQSGTSTNVILDTAGNLYGTTIHGGSHGAGSIFELMRNGSGWTYVDLHDFDVSDGTQPVGNLLFDPNGNLYGTTVFGGAYDNGVVWELTR